MRYSPFFGLAADKTWFCLIGGTWLGEDFGVSTVWRLYPVDLTMDLSSFKYLSKGRSKGPSDQPGQKWPDSVV
jgi:hypothetical protein